MSFTISKSPKISLFLSMLISFLYSKSFPLCKEKETVLIFNFIFNLVILLLLFSLLIITFSLFSSFKLLLLLLFSLLILLLLLFELLFFFLF